MKVIAGIVLYNPNIKRLSENIKAICDQVDEVILFDNGSKNKDQILSVINKKSDKCFYIPSKSNKGIAYALNVIATVAKNRKYNWLLTLDQDSIAFPNLVRTYIAFLNKSKLKNIGQLTCNIKDRNIPESNQNLNNDNTVEKVPFCITSGTLINLNALYEVGGFDSSFFIDWVDIEISYALRSIGYDTYKINFVGVLHELGHFSQASFFNVKVGIFNHAPIRYFYMARNSVIVSKRFPAEDKMSKALQRQMKIAVKVLLFEKQKNKKMTAIMKGIIQGIKKRPTRGRYLN